MSLDPDILKGPEAGDLVESMTIAERRRGLIIELARSALSALLGTERFAESLRPVSIIEAASPLSPQDRERLQKLFRSTDLRAEVFADRIVTSHQFVGRLDRDCDVCGRADRDPIHILPADIAAETAFRAAKRLAELLVPDEEPSE